VKNNQDGKMIEMTILLVSAGSGPLPSSEEIESEEVAEADS
jgi:hypothetical protein